MARRMARPKPEGERMLRPLRRQGPACGGRLSSRYAHRRTVMTLRGLVRLRWNIHRCEATAGPRSHRPDRPEAEGAIVLPQPEFGLDVIAWIGALRSQQHRRVPEIHRTLCARGITVWERTVTNLLDRYDELLATALTDRGRVREALAQQGRVILALDGLQPDVPPAAFAQAPVMRCCGCCGMACLGPSCGCAACCGRRRTLWATADALAMLITAVAETVGVPIVGVVSDGQRSLRLAVAKALPGVPHQVCHFHDRREAALPIDEADRHAKKDLKKRVRGVRPIERQVEGRDDPAAQGGRGSCAAVRSALSDDGRPPLSAAGLKRHDRLQAVAASLHRRAQ